MKTTTKHHYEPRHLCTCEAHCRQVGHTSIFEADLTRAAKRIDGPFGVELFRQFVEELDEKVAGQNQDCAPALRRLRTVRRVVFGVDAVPVDLQQYLSSSGGT